MSVTVFGDLILLIGTDFYNLAVWKRGFSGLTHYITSRESLRWVTDNYVPMCLKQAVNKVMEKFLVIKSNCNDAFEICSALNESELLMHDIGNKYSVAMN